MDETLAGFVFNHNQPRFWLCISSAPKDGVFYYTNMKNYIISYRIESLDAGKAREGDFLTQATCASGAITDLYLKIEGELPDFIQGGRITYAIFIKAILEAPSLETV